MLRIMKAAALTFCFFLVSCDFLPVNIVVDFNYNLFSSKMSAWQSTKPLDYQYNFSTDGDGWINRVDTLIIVKDGEYKEDSSNIEYGDTLGSDYQTIDNIYTAVKNIYKESNNTPHSKFNDIYLTKINVEYDSKNNIPVKIEFLYNEPFIYIADAGSYWVWEIKNFEKNSR